MKETGCKRIFSIRFFLLCITATLILPLCQSFHLPVVYAAGNFSYSINGNAFPGKTIELSLTLPEEVSIVGFRCGISFEAEKLSCTRIKGNGVISGNSLYSRINAGEAVCVYAAANGAPSRLSGALITFTLSIPEDAIGAEFLTVKLWADQVCGAEGVPLETLSSFSETIQIPISSVSGDRLSLLQPDVGELTPAFSPDIFTYSMVVPSKVKEIHFDTQAKNGAAIKVNRRTLQAPGKNTEFHITLTSENKEKTVYTVSVYRSPSDSSSNITAEKNSSQPKSSSRRQSGREESISSTASKKGDSPSKGQNPESGPGLSAPQDSLQILQNQLPGWTGILSLLFSGASFVIVLYSVCFRKKKGSLKKEASSSQEKEKTEAAKTENSEEQKKEDQKEKNSANEKEEK